MNSLRIVLQKNREEDNYTEASLKTHQFFKVHIFRPLWLKAKILNQIQSLVICLNFLRITQAYLYASLKANYDNKARIS